MDKKNTVIGVLLLLAALGSFYLSAKFAPKPVPPPAASTPETSAGAAAAAAGEASAPAASIPPAKSGETELRSPPPSPAEPARTVTLQNDVIAVTFTTTGGAIDHVTLKKFAAVQGKPERLRLNLPHAAPALSFAGFPGADASSQYELVSSTDTEVVFRATVPGQLEVTRRYSIAPGSGDGQDPYHLRHETTFHNLTDKPLNLPAGSVNLGTASPINDSDYGLYLNIGYYTGKKAEFIKRSQLEGGGVLSWIGMKSSAPPPYIEEAAPVVWASAKNQFFTSILTLEEPGTGVRVERYKVNPTASLQDRRAYGVTGYAQFSLKPLAPEATSSWKASYYAGPKEYRRLANSDHFKHNEDLAMQLGYFSFFAKILLTLLTWVHSWLPSWGWAVVVATLILKTVTLPFTLAASRSSKRMQKLMPHMTALREKFKDNPGKMNEAMMRLYKEHKVNPLGGCIPILITIPFFIGFFSMLQSASELRFVPFLWAKDLSAPDTVGHIFGFPINVMPLLMGATMLVQTRLTPTPTTDNAQAAMMKFMPLVFMMFCYNFSCALALYSTVNGLYTIGQQLVINRLPEPQLTTAGGTGPANAKNVTPRKNKR